MPHASQPPSSGPMQLARRLLLPWLALTLVVGAFYHWSGLNIQTFRAESGLFIAWAYSGDLAHFVDAHIYSSYSGHYTPLYFAAELLQARLFSTNEHLWFWRQMLLLGLLGTALASLTRTTLAALGNRRGVAQVAGYLLAVVFLLQPAVAEMVTWPFMAAQFLCMTCAAIGLRYLIRASAFQDERALFWAMAWSYASMHFLGVGFVVSITTLINCCVLMWSQRLAPRHWRTICIFAVLTALHGVMMTRGVPTQELAIPPSTLVKRFGALYMGLVHGGLQSLWASGRFRWPDVDAFPVDAVYGLALLAALLAAAIAMAQRSRTQSRPSLMLASIVVGFPTLALALFSALPVLRTKGSLDPHSLDGYLFGTRYLIFATFFAYLPISALVGAVARKLGKPMLVPLLILSLGSAAGTAAFIRITIPQIWPYLLTPSDVLWANVVKEAATQQKAQGYVKDRPLSELDHEFNPPMHMFTPLIERDLGCSKCVNIESKP
ncbi:hypothetical protein J7373_12065 [Xanthomonas sp. A2111]|uniref:Glycosyltransferase RgtA/B/C/D-like domain-containing protein n=1 Tax=Xanthomonas hawaiiensis TaxID=3003247 RepID=A0ABU2I359_9XANT|nr:MULTISPECIES: hypothetical protein [unclassified Xanthomonas]MBO9828985.1 hypothetical protein [Xanthomonas sp. A2111]MBO9875595.1 hypothetical protein [Xanthomonas sp. D-93]MDS9992594.1 hypothetical protein [Xanthomonas sp. A2111]WNH44361.1 hypothetical protein PG878_17900 [Xanthomonas sp. A6251]